MFAFERARLLTACLLHYDPASCSSRARLSHWSGGATAKASLQGRKPAAMGGRAVRGGRPETDAIYPGPGRSSGKAEWRPERVAVEKASDEFWVGVKGQSSAEIAGSPRKL